MPEGFSKEEPPFIPRFKESPEQVPGSSLSRELFPVHFFRNEKQDEALARQPFDAVYSGQPAFLEVMGTT
jgi:hypothetical protein